MNKNVLEYAIEIVGGLSGAFLIYDIWCVVYRLITGGWQVPAPPEEDPLVRRAQQDLQEMETFAAHEEAE